MLQQSYTADNFERIFDIENRKNNIKDYLGKDYVEILKEIKTLDSQSAEIKRKRICSRTDEEIQFLNSLKQMREDLVFLKKEIQRNELEEISKRVNSKDFRFYLDKKDNDIFVIQKSKEALSRPKKPLQFFGYKNS